MLQEVLVKIDSFEKENSFRDGISLHCKRLLKF